MRHPSRPVSAAQLQRPARLLLAGPGCEVVIALARTPQGWPVSHVETLDDNQRKRAEAMGSATRRGAYLAGRWIANRIIAAAGSRQRLAETDKGEPRVAGDGPLRCASISHSRGWIAVALGNLKAVGIDLELSGPRHDWAAVACRLGWGARDRATFLRRWSLWEAAGKCHGRGAMRPRDALFDALLERLEALPAGRIATTAGHAATWLPVSTGWLAVVAADTGLAQLRITALPAALCPEGS